MFQREEMIYLLLGTIVIGATMAVTFKAIDQSVYLQIIEAVLAFIGGYGTAYAVLRFKKEVEEAKKG